MKSQFKILGGLNVRLLLLQSYSSAALCNWFLDKKLLERGSSADLPTANSSNISSTEHAFIRFCNYYFLTTSLAYFLKHFQICLIQVKSLSFLSQSTISELDLAFFFNLSNFSHCTYMCDVSSLVTSLFVHALAKLSSVDLEVLQGLQSVRLVGTSSLLLKKHLLRDDFHAKSCTYLMCTTWWLGGPVYTYETINTTRP